MKQNVSKSYPDPIPLAMALARRPLGSRGYRQLYAPKAGALSLFVWLRRNGSDASLHIHRGHYLVRHYPQRPQPPKEVQA